jgi:hypothetical protein
VKEGWMMEVVQELKIEEVAKELQEILDTYGKISIRLSEEEDFKKLAKALPDLLIRSYTKGLEKGLSIGNPSAVYKVSIDKEE